MMESKKMALITGSYGGLGSCSCLVNIHAFTGEDLVLVGRSQSKFDAQAEEIRQKYHVTVNTITADFSNP